MDATVKILKLISDHGMTDAQFTRETGISNGLVGQWRTGKQKPSLKNIQKIANYFNMDVSDFISDGDPDSWVTIIKNNPAKAAFAGKLAELDDEVVKALISLADSDMDTLLKIEKIIDVMKEERQS